jgi:hypothetical protein
MRFIKKQLLLWLIVLIFGVAAIAIPSAPRVPVATKAQVDDEEYWARRVERRLDRRQEYLDRQTKDDKDDAEDSKDSKDDKDADDEDDVDDVDKDIERRREYWRKRLDDEW